MGLVQYIYTSVVLKDLSVQEAFDIGSTSVGACQQLEITGRVFGNRQEGLAIMEGPEEHVARYYQGVQDNPLTGLQILHVKRSVKAREFEDFSVWLNVGQMFRETYQVRNLTSETLPLAWPENLSAKVRIMADAYLDADMLKAS